MTPQEKLKNLLPDIDSYLKRNLRDQKSLHIYNIMQLFNIIPKDCMGIDPTALAMRLKDLGYVLTHIESASCYKYFISLPND